MPWKPANGHHAIERAAVSFVFRDSLTPYQFERVIKTLSAKASSIALNDAVNLPAPFQVNFIQAGPLPSPMPQQISGPLGGRSLRKLEGQRVIEDVTLNGEAVVYSVFNYARWENFMVGATALFPETLSALTAATEIREIRLEYWDRFDRHPDGGADEPLIAPSSNFIGEILRHEPGSWHAHIGFFTDLRTDKRTLVNMNVDTITSMPNNPQAFSGGVTGQARIYSMASIQKIGDENALGEWMEARMELDRAHILLKEALADIIHPKIADAINLGASPLKLV